MKQCKISKQEPKNFSILCTFKASCHNVLRKAEYYHAESNFIKKNAGAGRVQFDSFVCSAIWCTVVCAHSHQTMYRKVNTVIGQVQKVEPSRLQFGKVQAGRGQFGKVQSARQKFSKVQPGREQFGNVLSEGAKCCQVQSGGVQFGKVQL